MKKYKNPSAAEWPSICLRPVQDSEALEQMVLPVFEDIRKNGDQAVRKYTEQFDKVRLDRLEVNAEEIDRAEASVSADLKQAIMKAYDNIYKFHKAQKTSRMEVETTQGVLCWREKRPIEKVGLYIPGGTAPLFSTILMLAIPARIAGCKEVVLCTPPDKNGEIDPAILFTAGYCGLTKIFKIGGIQAIGAMTFGTESIPAVYKIFGPGNQYVTAAKQVATRFQVAIDMPAGPSELLVMADDVADPSFVASDLLSQAEHGADSQVILVSTSQNMIDEVENEVSRQLEDLPRKALALRAIENSRFVYFNKREDALGFINEYGPEHYILCSREEDYYLDGLINAGSVFVGNYTPESAGDYASGTNHTLPTQGYAKQYSGVSLDSFLKSITFQKISEQGLQNIGKTVEVMAKAEGLQAHKNAVSIRLRHLMKKQ